MMVASKTLSVNTPTGSAATTVTTSPTGNAVNGQSVTIAVRSFAGVNAVAKIAGAGSAGATASNFYGTGFYGAGIYAGTRIYEDTVLSPAPTVVLASLASTAVSNPFTPPPNSLVIVAVDIGFHTAVPGAPAVSVADSAGNNYLPNTQIYDGSTNGSYFFSFAYGPQTQSITLTVTRSVTSQALIQITPRIIIGAANNQGGTGTAVVPSGSSAVSVVQNTTLQLTASLTTATVTLPSPTTSGNSLVACVLTNGNSANPVVTGLTLGGSPDHWAGVAKADPTQSYGGEIWYDPNCASGQTVVTVTCGSGAGGSPGIWLAVYEVTGAIAADQASANADGTGTATTWTSGTTSVTSRTNEIAFGIMRGRLPVVVTGDGTFTTQSLNEAVTGFQAFPSTRTATFTGSQAAFIYVSVVATFAGPATGGSSSTQVNGAITTNRAGSLVYVTGTVGSTETGFTPAGGTNQIAAASSATDTEAAAVGRLPGVGATTGTFPVGWTVPTAAPFSLAALEVFGPLADVNSSIAGTGTATATAIKGNLVSVTANIGGTGVAGSGANLTVAGKAAGAGAGNAVFSGGLEFEFGTAQGAGVAGDTGNAQGAVPTIGALGTAQGAGAASTQITQPSGPGTAAGAGTATAVPTVGAVGAAAGAGAMAVGASASGSALGAGVALAVPTLPAGAGTATGAGATLILSPVLSVSAAIAGTGTAGALPVLRVLSGTRGTGVATSTGTGLPQQPLAAIAGAGVIRALPQLTLTAALRGAAVLAVPAPAGAVNTDDTIEPGPCTLFMAVGQTTSRAGFSPGATGPDGSTVGGSTSAMAVGNLVSDRGN